MNYLQKSMICSKLLQLTRGIPSINKKLIMKIKRTPDHRIQNIISTIINKLVSSIAQNYDTLIVNFLRFYKIDYFYEDITNIIQKNTKIPFQDDVHIRNALEMYVDYVGRNFKNFYKNSNISVKFRNLFDSFFNSIETINLEQGFSSFLNVIFDQNTFRHGILDLKNDLEKQYLITYYNDIASSICGFYEAFRYLDGLLLFLFDYNDRKNPDPNLDSYFNEKNESFAKYNKIKQKLEDYSKSKDIFKLKELLENVHGDSVETSNRLTNVPFFIRVFRNSDVHNRLDIEQDKIRQGEYAYLVFLDDNGRIVRKNKSTKQEIKYVKFSDMIDYFGKMILMLLIPVIIHFKLSLNASHQKNFQSPLSSPI